MSKTTLLICLTLLVSSATPLCAANLIYSFSLSYSPEWTMTGDWQFGWPMRGGSACGDPMGGHTGLYAYGCNLAGDYSWWQGEQYLTTSPLDCSKLSSTRLRFYRWLGVSRFDRAAVQASNDGSAWQTVWVNPTDVDICDGEWVLCEYDISSVADGKPTVYIRWVMGPTEDNPFPGWNIDDIEIWGETPEPPLQILAWVPYADLWEEYPQTLEALSSHYPNYAVTESTTLDPATLAVQLAGKHVFLVPEPEMAAPAELEEAGTAFSSVLQSYVASGGTVIECGEYAAGLPGFMTATGLMSATYTGYYWLGNLLPVVAPSHPLAVGLGPTVAAQDATRVYNIAPEATSIIEDDLGWAALAVRDYGYGAAVMVGYDYYAWDVSAARVIANAVQYPRSTYQVLLYEQNNVAHAAKEALHRLGIPYTLAGSADFNSLLASREWDLVVVDAPSDTPADPEGWSPLIDYTLADGNVALSTWELAGQPELAAAFRVEGTETLSSIPPIYRWEPANPLFTIPRSLPHLVTWADHWPLDADRLTVTDRTVDAVAGYSVSASDGQAALVIAHSGSAILNAFLWDERNQDADADGIQDCVELVMNEIMFLLRGPHASFNASPTEGVKPLSVAFSDLSSADCTAWQWQFGDGEMSNQQNHTHSYPMVGFYDVTLTATNPWCSDVERKLRHISVGFPDVPPSHWAFRQPIACYVAGIVFGYRDGSYQPDVIVTRDQMAVYTARAIAGGDSSVPDPMPPPTFPDVLAEHWAYKYIEYAVSQNVVQGYTDGTYRPELQLDRGQMAVFMARAMVAPGGDPAIPDPVPPPTFPDVTANNEWAWCYKHVEHIAGAGVVQGYPDGKYHPENLVSRDQMAVYIQRAFHLPT